MNVTFSTMQNIDSSPNSPADTLRHNELNETNVSTNTTNKNPLNYSQLAFANTNINSGSSNNNNNINNNNNSGAFSNECSASVRLPTTTIYWNISHFFLICAALRNTDNISCKTLFFSEKLQTFTSYDKMHTNRKSIDVDFGKNLMNLDFLYSVQFYIAKMS